MWKDISVSGNIPMEKRVINFTRLIRRVYNQKTALSVAFMETNFYMGVSEK